VPDTLTEYYDLVKPEIEASADTWGEKLNADLDKIDTALRNCLVTSSPPSLSQDPLIAQGTELPLYLPAQVAGSAPTHTQLAATQGWVEGRILYYMNRFMPVGTIMMWWGQLGDPNTFPKGWGFCDGVAGSPDLRGRFVLCAGAVSNGTIGAQTYGGQTTIFPGEHTHANSYITYPGPTGPQPLEVHNANAIYPGNTSTLPYCALAYIYKYAAW
jgi:hypothetical protein